MRLRRAASLSLAAASVVAAQDPSPALHATSPAQGRGTLVISGGAETDTEIYRRFIELAGGRDAPIVVVPTSGTAETYDSSCVCLRWLKEAGARNLSLLHTRDRAIANSEAFVRPLRAARGVWFAEGNSWRYQDAYLDTQVHREVLALLERGGVVGGGSAGGRIQGEYIPLRSPEPKQRAIPEKDWRRGFALLPKAAIDAHVLARNRQFDLVSIVKEHAGLLGLGIDENTAIVVHGQEFEVIGSSYVVVYDPNRQLLADGPDESNRTVAGPFYMMRRGDTYNLATRQAYRGPLGGRPIDRVIVRPWTVP